MALDDVEVVRRNFELYARRDDPRAREALRELWHADARWRPWLVAGGALEGTTFEGHQGLTSFMDAGDEEWSELAIDVLELRPLGAGCVLAYVSFDAVGRRSGARVGQVAWTLFWVLDGRIAEGRRSRTSVRRSRPPPARRRRSLHP